MLFLMKPRPPGSTLTDTLFPYPSLVRARSADRERRPRAAATRCGPARRPACRRAAYPAEMAATHIAPRSSDPRKNGSRCAPEIGRAHVCTPVTNAHLVCRLLLEQKKIRQSTF